MENARKCLFFLAFKGSMRRLFNFVILSLPQDFLKCVCVWEVGVYLGHGGPLASSENISNYLKYFFHKCLVRTFVISTKKNGRHKANHEQI